MNNRSDFFSSMFAHELNLRIYYEDTDVAGMVYHANYLKFMDRGRTEWLRAIGFEQGQIARRDSLIFVVAGVRLDFKKPVYLDEEIVVRTVLKKMGGVSLGLYQAIKNEHNEINCEGFIKLGCVDAVTYKLKMIPEKIKRRIHHGD